MYCQDFCLYWDNMAVRQFLFQKMLLVLSASQAATPHGATGFAWVNDQHIMGDFIKNCPCGVRVGLIGSIAVANFPACVESHEALWSPGAEFDIPENCLAFHANWTVGVDNKLALLEYVNKKSHAV